MAHKPKNKAIKHSASGRIGWPQSITPFEFLVPHSINHCILMLWEEKRWHKNRRTVLSERPYYLLLEVQQRLPDIADFTIGLVAPSQQITTIFRGTLEALNDGSTAVRGSVLVHSPILELTLFIALTTFMAIISGILLFSLFGIGIAAYIWAGYRQMQRRTVRKIESYLGSEQV